MESLFGKDPNERPEPTVYDRIGPEIAHLDKGGSVRHGARAGKSNRGQWTIALLLIALISLYIMDPVLYALHKSDAIPVYLYLHNYDSANAPDALVGTGMFSPDEIETLNEQHNADQSAFASPRDAEKKAASIVSYIDQVKALHKGKYEDLTYLSKIRYVLFIKTGLIPPISWTSLTPKVK